MFEDSLEHGDALLPIEAYGYAARTGGRVVLVDRDGTSLIDTSPALELGRDFSSRPEIAEALAGERVDTWRPLAEERSVTLDYLGPVTVPAVAMRGAVEQILDNLLSNALEVAPDGSSIRVVAATSTTAASLSVIDEGPGMSDAEIAQAFDRFFTTNGTGLGLAIARQLAQASRGSARLRRAPGGGLDVSITLRRASDRSPN